jgi:alkylated DNA repair protein (DNA oxidative demethylase)
MSVAMTNCGRLGGSATAPVIAMMRSIRSETAVAAMPDAFVDLALRAADKAGCEFPPRCLSHQSLWPGAKLSLHQDKDELDFNAPIVSVSLGLPATFLFGGLNRNDKTARYRLAHGDVVVWGGPARLAYHGVLPLADGDHPLLGSQRINLTFRKTR